MAAVFLDQTVGDQVLDGLTDPAGERTAREVDMEQSSLEEDLLRALRSAPEPTLDELADAVGLPRTNYDDTTCRRRRVKKIRLIEMLRVHP